jgi:cytoskeletal protein CcmA (bactofilin family)
MSTCRCKRVAGAPILAVATAGIFLGGLQTAFAQDSTGNSPRVHIRVNDDNNGVTIRTKDGVVRTADYVRFGEKVHVKPDEHINGDVVVIANDLLVEGRVTGDCVAIGGDLRLAPGAIVDGEVVCIGGTLTLSDSAQVEMSATSVWGDLEKSDSATVGGEVSVIGGPRIEIGGDSFNFGEAGSGIWRFVTRLVWILVLIFLGIMVYYIFPSRMRRLADTVEHRGLVSFLAGLAGWILWLPVFILLCVTLVGIPVALLLILLTPIMALVGYLGVALSVGRKTGARLFGGAASGVGTMLMGVFLLEGSILFGNFFRAFPSVFQLLGLILTVIGISVIFIAGTMGFGAFLMTRFRPEQAPPSGMAAPPPPIAGA